MHKYIGIALGASVLLNAFMGGFLISKSMGGHSPPAFGHPRMGENGPPRPDDMMLRQLKEKAHSLSSSGEKKVLDILKEYEHSRPEHSIHTEKEKVFSDIHTTLLAETFDAKKLEMLHKQITIQDNRFKSSIGDIVVKIASSLSKEDRQTFFKDIGPGRHGPHAAPIDEGPPPDDF